jgi:hypothetical protein
MLIFSDWIPDDANLKVRGAPNLKMTMGLVLLAMICLYILIKLSLMACALALEFKAKWRKRQTIKMRLKGIELRASIHRKNDERRRQLVEQRNESMQALNVLESFEEEKEPV